MIYEVTANKITDVFVGFNISLKFIGSRFNGLKAKPINISWRFETWTYGLEIVAEKITGSEEVSISLPQPLD